MPTNVGREVPARGFRTNHSILRECGQADPASGRHFLIVITPGERVLEAFQTAAASPSEKHAGPFTNAVMRMSSNAPQTEKTQRPKDTQSVHMCAHLRRINDDHTSVPPPPRMNPLCVRADHFNQCEFEFNSSLTSSTPRVTNDASVMFNVLRYEYTQLAKV